MSSVKWSDPVHFLKAQGKFIFSFPCTFFLHILTPKNYKLSLKKVSWVAPFYTTMTR